MSQFGGGGEVNERKPRASEEMPGQVETKAGPLESVGRNTSCRGVEFYSFHIPQKSVEE